MINKVVYSHWSKPAKDDSVGFNSKEAFSNSFRLSLLTSKQWADEVELVTDKKGYDLLIKDLKLPFDNVKIELDTLNKIDTRFWAIGKLHACMLQDKPFMHLDMDAFWFKKPPRHILNAEACFQNWETDEYSHQYYRRLIYDCHETPELKMHKYVDFSKVVLNAVCCGFMGYNNLKHIPEWYDLALDYINTAGKIADPMNVPSIMFEQYFISNLLKHYKVPITTLGHKWVSEPEAKKYGYTHLISQSKRKKEIEIKVKNRLKKELKNGFNTYHI